MKLNVKKFALTGGIFMALWLVIATALALLQVPGITQFVTWMVQFTSAYGYTLSVGGLLIGAVESFVKGYLVFGLFAWLYNKLG